ncbi:phage tail assembly chaperone [Pseudomonas rhodesiae]|uniref:phage tail assembly chaperone n=1 Tax=Pseudomonas rhodesiae TaxID=76760 RepID=UPI000FF22DB0|nr:phage tail assembly chaperone [Pseudomonas rhodesiae]ROM60412.1 hypothetical protein BK650_03045 [Pseudomonas rhodesiae]ROM68066.1 hypothetical protein BK651_02995 [Pseudomonas rhodesiae]
MAMFYSPSERGFFDTALNSKKQIPSDAIAVTEPQRTELLAGISRGLLAQVSKSGSLELVEPPIDPADVALAERAWRDAVLTSAAWLRERHRDQLEIGAPTTLTAEQFEELLVYMQALRDWPQSPEFPDSTHRPIAPTWLDEQAQ